MDIIKENNGKRLTEQSNTDCETEEIAEFLAYMDKINHISEAELQKQYNKEWEIKFNNMTLKIPFDAVSFNAIYDALKQIKSEQ